MERMVVVLVVILVVVMSKHVLEVVSEIAVAVLVITIVVLVMRVVQKCDGNTNDDNVCGASFDCVGDCLTPFFILFPLQLVNLSGFYPSYRLHLKVLPYHIT